MKLSELMDKAFDETWFCVVTPDGKEHYFWNADYLGWHPDVMPELEPLLDREFDEFELTIRDDPEAESKSKAKKVPMILVGVLMTDEELEQERKKAEKAEKAEKAGKAKKAKKSKSHKKSGKKPKKVV